MRKDKRWRFMLGLTRKRQQSSAAVKVSIEELLDEGLPEVYTREIFQKKVDAVYQHVYEAYQGSGQSLYAGTP